MSVDSKHKRLADQLGLSGAWTTVSKTGLLDEHITLARGYYFLAWGDYAIIWEEGVKAGAYWLAAYHMNDHQVWRGVFRGGVALPTRTDLLQQVGFTLWKHSFSLVELYPTKTPWEWPSNPAERDASL
jgi:hypothetical protein